MKNYFIRFWGKRKRNKTTSLLFLSGYSRSPSFRLFRITAFAFVFLLLSELLFWNPTKTNGVGGFFVWVLGLLGTLQNVSALCSRTNNPLVYLFKEVGSWGKVNILSTHYSLVTSLWRDPRSEANTSSASMWRQHSNKKLINFLLRTTVHSSGITTLLASSIFLPFIPFWRKLEGFWCVCQYARTPTQ